MKTIILQIILIQIFISADIYSQQQDTIVLKEGLVIKMQEDGNKIISPDIIAGLIETGRWKDPSVNEKVMSGKLLAGIWKNIKSDNIGWFQSDSLVNAYVYFSYYSEIDDIVLLEGMGNSMVYVNGSPRSGNPYRYKDNFESWEPRFDYSLLPIKVNKGNNRLVFKCDRGILKVKIHKHINGLLINEKDLTLPDLIINENSDTYGSISIINATDELQKNLSIKTSFNGSEPTYYDVNQMLPLSIIKAPFHIKLPAQSNEGKIQLQIQLVKKVNAQEENLSSAIIGLNIVKPGEIHKETFVSNIDGSVQYYAVNPPQETHSSPALFLSLHGAGVEAINQALSYSYKNWGYIICPTNRRPYGFNWENWGRLDALEVLDITEKEFNVDKDKIYLTGHSMGGHGAWHLGINYAGKFAAIGPSAGWISIWSYRIKPVPDSTDIKNILMRSAKQSDTYAFCTNLKPNGIYILQGSADDNVPVDQPLSMIKYLAKFHKDYIYYEQPGAGHWWDNSDEPGVDCVDWVPMFDFFAHHANPGIDKIKMIDYVTSNPAVSSKNYWVEIINQIKQQTLSKVNIRLEAGNRKFSGTTNNIEVLQINASMLSADKPVAVEIDSQIISGININKESKIILRKENGKWEVINKINPDNKNPQRCGNLREVLNNNVLFVYGTHGSKKEIKDILDKVKYDSERLWYQGNSSIEIINDDDFDLTKYKDRNVVLFGNSASNSAWNLLMKDSPITVNNKNIIIGEREYSGDDYACLMIRPRRDSKTASVAVISGTGQAGMKIVDFTSYFHPYQNFPDIIIYNSDILKSDEEGIKFTGYFGNDWSIEKGEIISNFNSSNQ